MTHRLAVFACLTVAAISARGDDIDRYIAQERQLYGLPAVVLGVYRDGQLVDQRASGIANLELQVPASIANVFEIGSISKQFTAYAILILLEQGKIDLQATVGRYLPELPEAWGAVTLHRLLTHTSGLPDLEDAFGYGIYRETPGDAEFMKRLLMLPVEFKPGDKWQYSNTNYWLLAKVIENVSGLPYADFMAQRIFAPLGMKSTRSALPSQLLPNRASGYQRAGNVIENRDAMQPHTARGLGDIVTTIADMAMWEREQLAPRLVSAATAELPRQPVKLKDGSHRPYGYGWSTEKLLPLQTLSHEGQTAGFTAAYIRVPEKRLATVVLINAFNGVPGEIGMLALEATDVALKRPKLEPIADADSTLTKRVGEILSGAVSPMSDWRKEWFTDDYWRSLEPWLLVIAENNKAYGRLRGVTLVGVDEADGDVTRTYRARYESVSRIVILRFDKEGRVSSRRGRDE
jgi:CubicO group peptidase (beta-lactamase class C family)